MLVLCLEVISFARHGSEEQSTRTHHDCMTVVSRRLRWPLLLLSTFHRPTSTLMTASSPRPRLHTEHAVPSRIHCTLCT